MAAKNEAKIRFLAETSEFSDQIKQANQSMSELRSELRLSEAQFKGNESSVEALTAKKKILQQQLQASGDKVDALRQKLEKAKTIYGENSSEVSKLKIQLNNAQREYVTTETAIKGVADALNNQEQEAEQAANATKDLDDAVGSAGDGFTVFKGVLANLASTAITSLVSGIGDLARGLWDLDAETRELRTNLGKLETAFTTSGFSAQTASDTYNEFYGIVADEGQATEAVSHLAKLTDSQKGLSEWTTICTGVYATFGDSLPIENLTEAANETAKTGALTGGLADALNWAGVNEEEFQAKLDATNTEAEREALIRKTLTGLYGEAAAAYQETNGQIMAANKAQSEYNTAMAGLGELIEPVKTQYMSGMAQMLTSVKDFATGTISANEMVGKMKDVVGQAIQGISGYLPQLGQMGIQLISSLAQGVATGLPQLVSGAANVVTSLAQGIANNAQKIISMGGQLIMSLGQSIISASGQLITTGANILKSLASGITGNTQSFISKGLDLLNGFADTLTSAVPKLVKNGMEFIRNLVKGLMNSLPELISRVPEIISKFANVINDNAPTIIAGGVGIIKDLIVGIVKAIPTLIKNIPKIITAIVDVWQAFNWANLGKKAITLLKDGCLKVLGLVKSAGTKVLTTITDALKALPSKLLELGKNGVMGIVNGIKAYYSKVLSVTKTIWTGIFNTLKDLPSKLLGIGKDLVKGLWNGISDMTGWVIDKIKGFGESVLGGIKRFFGIESPSKVMRDQVGRYLAEGVGEGIAENEDAAISPMEGLVDKIKGIDVAGEWGKLSGAGGALNYDVSAQLGDYVSSAIGNNSPYAYLGSLIDAVEDLASRAINLYVDDVRLATATASASDSVSGNRLNLRTRGLAL